MLSAKTLDKNPECKPWIRCYLKKAHREKSTRVFYQKQLCRYSVFGSVEMVIIKHASCFSQSLGRLTAPLGVWLMGLSGTNTPLPEPISEQQSGKRQWRMWSMSPRENVRDWRKEKWLGAGMWFILKCFDSESQVTNLTRGQGSCKYCLQTIHPTLRLQTCTSMI